MILNWMGMIIGGIWLVILGDWTAFLLGLALISFGHVILAFALIPGIVSTLMTVQHLRDHKFIKMISLAKVRVYNFLIELVWCVGIFAFSIDRPHSNVWPYLLWAYAVAVTSWQTLAQKELKLDPKSAAIVLVAGAQFGSLAMVVSALMGQHYQIVFGLTAFFAPAALVGMVLAGIMYTISYDRNFIRHPKTYR